MNEDLADVVSRALRSAFQLGQTYWQQADSERSSQWARADATRDKFNDLLEDTRTAITKATGEMK